MNESDPHTPTLAAQEPSATAGAWRRRDRVKLGRPGVLARTVMSLMMLVAGACSAATPPSPATPLGGASAAPSQEASSHPAPAPTPSATLAPRGPQVVPQTAGTFEGELASATETFPVRFWIDGCGEPDEVCGVIEYTDPKHSEFDLCAPLMVFLRRDGAADVFTEVPAYRADACPPVALRIDRAAADRPTLDVKPYGDTTGAGCCRGTLVQTSGTPPAPAEAPRLPAIDGLAGPLTTSDLVGPTTPFSTADENRAYFPTQGEVIGVDLVTGESTELAYNRDYASTVDPKSVAAVGEAIWAARGPQKMLVRIDDAGAGMPTGSISLPHAPYAMAGDGTMLWVTSLDDSVVMAVDTESRTVAATIDVPSPSGVAVGGGAIWVVERADDRLARIDPATAKVTAEVALGVGGDDPVCGMCVESVVYAFDSAWTANGYGRSITRVEDRTLKTTTIPTPNRVWSVAAYGQDVYGSQFEELDGYIDRTVGGLVRIDPDTGKVEQLPAPGVLGVAALADRLWLIVPGRSSDLALTYRHSP